MQNSLLKPKSISVEQVGLNRAKVALEPFERGYGHTLGNALRRVLLSSMPGYAATEVTIAGVLHEYSSIDGIQEDVVNILLNLKGVVFKLHNRDEVTLSLRKDTEGVVTAADIQTPHDVEIINPSHVIAHLSSGGKLDMQIKVEKGRGYVPGSMRRHADEPTKSIGRMVLDASFSPVKRVSYVVESASWWWTLKPTVLSAPKTRSARRHASWWNSSLCLRSWKAMSCQALVPQRRAAKPSLIRFCCVRSMSSNSPCVLRTA